MPIGQQIGMTNIDVMKVNIAYNCNLCRKKFLDSGTFTFTSANQEASSCLYLIQSSVKVLLQLSDVNIPSSPDCKDAYIKVYDGVSKSSPVFLDRTCGKVSLPPLVSSEDHLLIEIVNNKPSAEITFKASYKPARFGKTHVTDYGAVMSPLFPGIYPRNVDAFYSIIAPKGYKVSLNIDFFWMSSSSDCTEEYLIIRESMTSPIVATYCGYLYPIPPMVSSGNTLVLQFHSSPSPYHNGFHAFYHFVPSS
ncbi:embryonic protein UVS.2-like [Engystomops pustulosus]|uniref:embryonic protein UVS.2-like n=1 Tax=Engystomops pustulosus TaxID=76066 RepID=UPI003AFA3D35